jgi:hypothetical protein
VNLPSGTWFWRACPVSKQTGRGNGEWSAGSAGKIVVTFAAPPSLISPGDGYVYRYRSRKPGVRFQWSAVSEASSYILEAADNPDITNPRLRETIPAHSARAETQSFLSAVPDAGTWYWRVTPVFPADYQGEAASSVTASFRIEQSGDLAAPLAQSPAENGFLNIAPGRGDTYFSWRGEAEAVSYTLRVSRERDLSPPVLERTSRDNFALYGGGETVLEPGRYYWGVAQTDLEGNSSAFSEGRAFLAVEGEVVLRAVFPPDNYTAADTLLPDTLFTWKTNLPFTTRFQISALPDFTRLTVDEAVSGETAKGRVLPVGDWYWRVKAATGPEAEFSTPPRRLVVAPPLAAPLLREPEDRLTVKPDEPALFAWNRVEDAEYYELRLYSGGDRGQPVFRKNFIEETRLSVPVDTFEDGPYSWTVQAFSGENPASSRRGGLLAEGAYTMRKLKPVSLDAPPPGHSFPGLEALRRPGEARWSSQDAGRARFILSRNPSLSGQPVMDIRDPAKTIALIRLPEGTYYWTVTAQTGEGFDISAASPSAFTVLPIPPLPPVPALQPEDAHHIGPEELRNSRTLNFVWQSVEDASGYIFTLYHEENGERRRLVSSGPSEESAYTLEDLRPLLVQGNFIWQVEAVYAEDGIIIRRGALSENRFTVQTPVPGQVRQRAPGTLYGYGE